MHGTIVTIARKGDERVCGAITPDEIMERYAGFFDYVVEYEDAENRKDIEDGVLGYLGETLGQKTDRNGKSFIVDRKAALDALFGAPAALVADVVRRFDLLRYELPVIEDGETLRMSLAEWLVTVARDGVKYEIDDVFDFHF